jgi:hypothetical protein
MRSAPASRKQSLLRAVGFENGVLHTRLAALFIAHSQLFPFSFLLPYSIAH